MDALFVNLQYGDTSAEVAEFSAKNNIKIYDWEDNDALLDLDNQAALISNLDLVISIDNATVHSCIALGTEVWDLINPELNLMWMDNGTGISPLSRHVQFFKKKNIMENSAGSSNANNASGHKCMKHSAVVLGICDILFYFCDLTCVKITSWLKW